MPYEVELEDGMKVQVSSLNGHDWSDYREKLTQAAREARSATPASNYATVLAVIKSNQWPSNLREQQCLTRWQLSMARHIQALGEATSKARNSEVPRAATTQPQEPQTALRQVHEETADATTTHSERAEPIAPADSSRDPPDMPPEDGARHRAGEGVDEVRIGAGGDEKVDHTETRPEGTEVITPSKPHSDEAHYNANASSASHTEPNQGSTDAAPRRDANAGARDGMRAQRRGTQRRRRGTREGGGGDAEPRERPDAARPGARSGPGTHLHHPNPMTSASARSASHDHADGDAKRTDPPRPSEDPEDAPSNDERCPDAPTEPPDMPEGTRGRGSREQVETRVTRVSESSRDVDEDPGEVGGEERRPARPDESPVEPRGVQVEPGGETGEAERSKRAAHEDADAEVDGEVVGTRRDAQVEVESTQMRCDTTSEGERARATVHTQSTATDDENDQRSEMHVDNVPEDPPDPSPSLPMPDQPPSVELEGERRSVASCDVGLTSSDADVTGAPRRVEDDGDVSRKLGKVSDREHERSKRRTRANLPDQARDEPDNPGGEAAVPDDIQSTKEGPRNVRNERADEMDAPDRDRSPGGHRGEQESLRGVEGVQGRGTVIERAGYDWIRTRSKDNECVVETNALRRDTRPGGHPGEQVGSADIQDNRERRDDGIGVGYDGNGCRMDGATSSARRESKRLKTRLLAEQKNISKSGTSTRWRTYLGHPYHLRVTPGRSPIMSTRRSVVDNSSQDLEKSVPGEEGPTRSHERIEAESGKSDRSYVLYMDQRRFRSGAEARYARTKPLESIEADHAHLNSATT
jgi:hypothetical protein